VLFNNSKGKDGYLRKEVADSESVQRSLLAVQERLSRLSRLTLAVTFLALNLYRGSRPELTTLSRPGRMRAV
jgi:hypothetical protein